MADNVTLPGTGVVVATDELTYSGDTAKIQLFRPVHVSGTEGAKTLTELVGLAGSPSTVALTMQGARSLHYRVVLAATTNAIRIKSGAGMVKGVYGFSKRATPFYAKLHDDNTSPPVAGSTAVALTIGFQAGLAQYVSFPDGGVLFSSGVGLTVVTGIADANADAVAAEDGVVMVFYV